MSNLILTDIADGILHIQVNRPEKKNALAVAMYSEMNPAPASDGRPVLSFLRAISSAPQVRAPEAA
jgi:hypothetical protein